MAKAKAAPVATPMDLIWNDGVVPTWLGGMTLAFIALFPILRTLFPKTCKQRGAFVSSSYGGQAASAENLTGRCGTCSREHCAPRELRLQDRGVDEQEEHRFPLCASRSVWRSVHAQLVPIQSRTGDVRGVRSLAVK